MKNKLKGLSNAKRIEVSNLLDEIYATGYEDGQAASSTVEDKSVETVAVVKSPNQQRAELIQRAREFVENIIGSYPNFEMDIGRFSSQAVSAKFHVNAKKRRVVVLIHGYFSRKLVCKGIAKCMPGDVFNEWIGKAIALAKALKIDIPQEFVDAVQPDEVVAGVILKWGTGKHYSVNKVDGDLYDFTNLSTKERIIGVTYKNVLANSKIIDDTNAEYEFASLGD